MNGFVRLGVWVWGSVTVSLALLALTVVVVGGLTLPVPEACKFGELGPFQTDIAKLFYALKENGSLVAGILGFSGLAWSNFFKAHSHNQVASETK
jgi:hypothetical protein